MPEERPPNAPDWVPEDVEAGNDQGSRKFVTDAVRKAFLAGVGALFMTEEGARKLAREWKLPKEVLGFVTAQAAGAKDEVLRVVSEEVRKFFRSEALRREFIKLLGSMTFELHAEVRLKESRGKLKTSVSNVEVRSKRAAAAAEEAAASSEEPEESAPGIAGEAEEPPAPRKRGG